MFYLLLFCLLFSFFYDNLIFFSFYHIYGFLFLFFLSFFVIILTFFFFSFSIKFFPFSFLKSQTSSFFCSSCFSFLLFIFLFFCFFLGSWSYSFSPFFFVPIFSSTNTISLTSKTGLQSPLGFITCFLKDDKYTELVSIEASIYLATTNT